ncbi:hypothetical protein AAE478_001038 [Parahypoxylon ruwenzoriense]
MENQVELFGTYRWIKTFDYHNDENVSITRTERYEWKRTLTSLEFQEKARQEGMRTSASLKSGIQAGGSYKIISASVSHNIELSLDINSTLNHLSRNETKKTFEEYDYVSQTFEIGPRGRIVAYQQEFLGPGISLTSKRIVTRPGPDPAYEGALEQVKITCNLKPYRFLSDIKVTLFSRFRKNAYIGANFKWFKTCVGRLESQTPDDHIPVIENKSPDVNHDFSESDFVWMIPKWTENASHDKTCTSVGYYKSQYHRSDAQDLASGAGGDYRYLQIKRNPNIPRKVVDIAMIRSNSRQDEEFAKKLGYDGMSSDLNEGREHDWVYLVWKTVDIDDTVKI